MSMRKTAFAAAAVFIIAQSTVGQQSTHDIKSKQKEPLVQTAQVLESAGERRNSNILVAHDLANRILGFQTISIVEKAVPLAELADILWPYDQDFARYIFVQLVSLLDSAYKTDMSTVTSSKSEQAKQFLAKREFIKAQTRVIVIITRRDLALAKPLFNQLSGLRLKEAPPRPEFHRQDGSTPPDTGRMGEIALIEATKMRSINAAIADKLYLQSLSTLIPPSGASIMDLMYLGGYVFTSPRLLSASAGQEGVDWIVVNNVRMVDLSVARRGVSPDVVHAYLKAAVDVISRPAPQDQLQLYRAAGLQLSSKVQQFAPELSASLIAAIQSLDQEQPRTDRTTDDRRIEGELAEIERIPITTTRDEKYFLLLRRLYSKGDFSRSREVLGRMQASDSKSRLEDIINAAEAATNIENDPELAERLLRKVVSPVEAVALRLGLANTQAAKGKKEKALELINEAWGLAESNQVDQMRKPYLMLATAAVLAKYKPDAAINAFRETIGAFYAEEAKNPAGEGINWQGQSVSVGQSSRLFDTSVKGVPIGDIPAAIQVFTKLNLEATKELVQNSQNEKVVTAGALPLVKELIK